MQIFNSFDALVTGQMTGCVSDMSTFNLNVSFADDTLEAKCTRGTAEYNHLSKDNRIVLNTRIPAILRAPTLEDLRHADGRFHELQYNRQGQLSCTFDSGDRLIFVPDHNPVPVDSNGNLDWSKVTAIKIIGMGNYHHGQWKEA